MRRRVLTLLSVLALSLAAMPPAAPQEGDPIVYSAYRYGGRRAGAGIFTIVPGGERVRLTGSRSFNLEPAWSPDRAHVAYVHHARPRNPDIWVMDADGSDKVRLTTGRPDDEYPRWSPDGSHIAWVKARGDSPAGRIYVMHPDGADKIAVTPEGVRAALPAWSPDGSRLAYVTVPSCNDCELDTEIHVVDAHTGEDDTVLTENDVDDSAPEWSPDGTRILFTREHEDGADLFTMAPDGSDQQRLTDVDGYVFVPEWSPDGSEVAFTLLVDEANFHTRLGVVDVDSGEERLLTDVETGGILPSWSPDGARIAFLGFQDAGYEVGVIGRDGSNPAPVTSSEADEAWLDW